MKDNNFGFSWINLKKPILTVFALVVVAAKSCSILNTRLLNFSNNDKILHRTQIGFLPGHRASEHIFSLRTLIDQHVTHSPRGKLYTCFVDFKKAFDSIWHQGLLVQTVEI